MPKKKLNEQKTSKLGSTTGQLNWLPIITWPEVSYQVPNTSSKIKEATIKASKETNKIIKFVKENKP